mmetsp:Transcript_147116/g.274005  ORF Transcript_147116/g.274005 Transcript_147116/m.274005 type:complete len:200 (-) Transcript_147116:128-727(-)
MTGHIAMSVPGDSFFKDVIAKEIMTAGGLAPQTQRIKGIPCSTERIRQPARPGLEAAKRGRVDDARMGRLIGPPPSPHGLHPSDVSPGVWAQLRLAHPAPPAGQDSASELTLKEVRMADVPAQSLDLSELRTADMDRIRGRSQPVREIPFNRFATTYRETHPQTERMYRAPVRGTERGGLSAWGHTGLEYQSVGLPRMG